MRRITGHWVDISTVGETARAFIPEPLPPKPELRFDTPTLELLGRANRALGQLEGLATLLPETSLFLYLYVRKEAVLSSQIEGTQSSLSDLLLYERDEIPGVPLEDVQEVSSYVAALGHGLARLREGFPMSLRLLCEIHDVLLAHGRGSGKMPGELRRSQNWIGGSSPANASFIPPPPHVLSQCMGDLEKFLNDQPDRTPVLIKAALAHVQFETIHPFLDGNGRLGRLMITLLLCNEGVLSEPILYLSLYFKVHRRAYYEHLQRVRTDGDWEGWLTFFLQGVVETAEAAVGASKSLLDLFADNQRRIEDLGAGVSSMLQVHGVLRGKPIASINEVVSEVTLSRPTVSSVLGRLREMGILREISGRRRGRLFLYENYIEILTEATES